jgi:hypothetical protein
MTDVPNLLEIVAELKCDYSCAPVVEQGCEESAEDVCPPCRVFHAINALMAAPRMAPSGRRPPQDKLVQAVQRLDALIEGIYVKRTAFTVQVYVELGTLMQTIIDATSRGKGGAE